MYLPSHDFGSCRLLLLVNLIPSLHEHILWSLHDGVSFGKERSVLLFIFFDKKQNTPYIYIHFGQIGY